MSTTATNYVNLIDQNFPVRGKDNDSQGFRDNFSNIAQAIKYVNQDLESLSAVAIKTNQTSTFYGHTIKSANFQNCSEELWDNGALTGNITIDYSLGSYQKLTLESGINNIKIINWPGEGKSAVLKLSISPLNNSITTVNFLPATSSETVSALGPSQNPFILSNTTNVFEIYNEFSTGSAGPKILVRLLNELIANSTSTIDQYAQRFILKSPTGNISQDHFYTISSSTGANSATVVQSTILGNPVVANPALVPNIITAKIVYEITASPTSQYATAFGVDSIEGIVNGASFNLTTTNLTLYVSSTSVGTNIVYCDRLPNNPLGFPVGISGKVFFRNPTFSDYGEKTAFPIMSTMVDRPANTSTGQVGVFKGSIQASENHLEVTYDDYGNGNTNTFVINTMAATTVTDNSVNLASTNFIHRILPYGSIIMWYGNVASIPFGWALCDGTNGTPDLRDKFIVGASSDQQWGIGANTATAVTAVAGATTSTGGSAATTLPQHTHNNVLTVNTQTHTHGITDPGHHHQYYGPDGILDIVYQSPNNGHGTGWNWGLTPTVTTDNYRDTVPPGAQGAGLQFIQNSTIGISQTDPSTSTTAISLEILTTGTVDTTHTNLPPFYALCFIMKTSGQ